MAAPRSTWPSTRRPGKRGFYTSFIQASVVGGFILSLAVVLAFKALISDAAWLAWGWRLPFLFSILLLAVSLWMRLKLNESPVFKALKESGGCAKNPFKESFTYPGNPKRLFVALFGIAAGLTVIWYTAMFSVLAFLQNPLRVDQTVAQLIAAAGALGGLIFYVMTGAISDRIGRKKPIVIGYALTLLLLFPLFWLIGAAAGNGAGAPPGAQLRPRCRQHRRHSGRDPRPDVPFGPHLRLGRRSPRRDVPAQHPLQLDVDPLSYRHRLFRRLSALDQPAYRGLGNGRSLFGALVYLGRGRDGARRHLVLASGDVGQKPD